MLIRSSTILELLRASCTKCRVNQHESFLVFRDREQISYLGLLGCLCLGMSSIHFVTHGPRPEMECVVGVDVQFYVT